MPDVVIPKQAEIGWIHRRIDDADVYFLSSQSRNAVGVSVGFRVTGRCPELWDPFTGQRRKLGVGHVRDGRTHVALSLAPSGSAIIVFRKKAELHSWTKVLRDGKAVLDSTPGWYSEHESKTYTACEVGPDSLITWDSGQYELIDTAGKRIHIDSKAQSQPIDGPWRLAFEKGWDTPAEIELPKLIPLSDHSDRAVKYYSGTTTYRKTIQLSTLGDRLMLDLGEVADIAEVWCNGRNVGTRWCPPFAFDLSQAAKQGMNEIVIKVTNTWRNQLIYDLSRPESQRKTWTTNPPRRRDEPPTESGLIGPVNIHIGSLRDGQ